MGLREYFRKRHFGKTPEPRGGTSASNRTKNATTHQPSGTANETASPDHQSTPSKTGHKLRFVVQEHHATALHYDFRLEIDGVLKSWAVPKGPSLNPHDHHLAIQTEDHPYEYRTFEGVIPEGNYGAGNVIIWDEGWYEARANDGRDSEKTLRAELRNGHLTFVLHGQKLHGEFALIKMPHAHEQNAWLLIKKTDEYASTQDVTAQNTSIKSHKRVDDLGAAGKLPDLSSFPRKTAPWQVNPMLCTLVDEPFSRDGWLFEIKWDGYRAIAAKHDGTLALYSRNHLDFSGKYPPIIEALRDVKHDVIVDGEIVVVGDDGVAHFEWMQNWTREPQGQLQYYIFDILWCDGRDVRSMPLYERKALLRAVLPGKSTVLRYSDDVETDGLGLFKQMQKRGLEGVVAKRADSPYREDARGQDWLKVKTALRQEVVIGGYTEPRGSRTYLGSLLVGVYDHGELVYVGHSGGGIPDEQRKRLQSQLAKLEQKTSPFKTEPKPNAPVHWVKPKLVCEMSFSEWTDEHYMRHPQFKGLRPDKEPSNVHRETAKKVSAPGATLPFETTHLDKIFFPKHKYTKGDLLHYYESVAEYILPYLQDRPLSLNRMPNGITGESFFQKNNDHLPDWVPHADIFSDSNNGNLRWIVGGRLDTLLYIVQLGSIEINPWNSRIHHLDKPDWIVIDLDPEGVTFSDVITVARTVKTVCDEWRIPCLPKTSGKTGIHIYIPMHAKYTYEQAKNLAHLIALEVNKREPKLTSVERMPEKRRHKIYLDFLQNREGQTLAAPYSVRPTPEASVATPLHWDEVQPGLDPNDFTIKNTLARLKRTGDLWKPTLEKGIDLAHVLKHIDTTTGSEIKG